MSNINEYFKRKNKMLDFLGGKCVKCSSEQNLQIDHIDPKTKNFDISKNWSISWDKLIKELKLCQILCYDCHLEKTINEGSLSKGWTKSKIAHGTVWCYTHYKCRCLECKIARYISRRYKTPLDTWLSNKKINKWEIIKNYVEQGLSDYKIAEITGLHRSSVQRARAKQQSSG